MLMQTMFSIECMPITSWTCCIQTWFASNDCCLIVMLLSYDERSFSDDGVICMKILHFHVFAHVEMRMCDIIVSICDVFVVL